MGKERKRLSWFLFTPVLFILFLLGCQTPQHAVSLKQELTYQTPKKKVEVTKISIYSKKWEGTPTTWVDVGLRNNDAVARDFRVIIALDEEPIVGATTAKPVAPQEEATVTISTTAKAFPARLSIRVEIAE